METETTAHETVYHREPSWYVWNPERGVKAISFDEARARQQALAASIEDPGKRFYVLKTVCSYETYQSSRTEYDNNA